MHTLIHCCAQGVCCPPESDQRVDALAQILEKGWPRGSGVDPAVPPPRSCFVAQARHLLKEADVVPKGIARYLHKLAKAASALQANGKADTP